jgi:UDP-2-acetamido-3-amino-2,3-dideoxy-glucuronate N-acetyltransferase
LDQYRGEDFKEVQKTTILENILENPEISMMAIAVPAEYHYEVAKSGLLAGKDVFVEKPLCLKLEHAQELISLASKNERILMVGHLLQYHPCIIKLQNLVKEGKLGKLYYLTSNRLNLGKIRTEENALWSFAPHDISVILSLLNHQFPDEIHCAGGSFLTTNIQD